MGQFVKETAHLNINQDKYNEGYERIFGRKDKSLYVETPSEEEKSSERQVAGVQVSEEDSTIEK